MTRAVLVANEKAIANLFVREYVDNGLDVYDAQRKPLGRVSDYDRPGGGFVITLARAGTCLFIPFRLIAKVKHRRVYLRARAQELTRRVS